MTAAQFQVAAKVDLNWSLMPMQVADVDPVLAIEQAVYAHPWSRNNFLDSLQAGYSAWVIRVGKGAAAGDVVGYFLLMMVVDEAHLLNLAVSKDLQGQGIGRYLMDHAVVLASEMQMLSILLEVRPSNLRALQVYQEYGFVQIGRRKGYYPAANGQREDALVMRFSI